MHLWLVAMLSASQCTSTYPQESFVSTQSNNTSFVAASPTGSLPASLRPSPSFLGRYSVGSVQKRKSEEQHGEDGEEEEEPVDTVRLWEDGWKERYYQDKYGLSSDDGEFVQKVVCSLLSDGNRGDVHCCLMVTVAIFSWLDCRLKLTQEGCAGCLDIITR